MRSIKLDSSFGLGEENVQYRSWTCNLRVNSSKLHPAELIRQLMPQFSIERKSILPTTNKVKVITHLPSKRSTCKSIPRPTVQLEYTTGPNRHSEFIIFNNDILLWGKRFPLKVINGAVGQHVHLNFKKLFSNWHAPVLKDMTALTNQYESRANSNFFIFTSSLSFSYPDRSMHSIHHQKRLEPKRVAVTTSRSNEIKLYQKRTVEHMMDMVHTCTLRQALKLEGTESCNKVQNLQDSVHEVRCQFPALVMCNCLKLVGWPSEVSQD